MLGGLEPLTDESKRKREVAQTWVCKFHAPANAVGSDNILLHICPIREYKEVFYLASNMNFEAIAQYVAQWAPYVFGGAVILLASANIYQKVTRLVYIRRAHALMARIFELRSNLPPLGASQTVLELLRKKADALASDLFLKLESETDEDKREGIAKELHKLEELKAQLETGWAEFAHLDAERAKLDAEILENEAFLAKLGPPQTLKELGKRSLLPVGNQILDLVEYIGNVSTKPTRSVQQRSEKEAQE